MADISTEKDIPSQQEAVAAGVQFRDIETRCLSPLLLVSLMSVVLATGNIPKWQQESQASSLFKNFCAFLGCSLSCEE